MFSSSQRLDRLCDPNTLLSRMASSGKLRCVALVRTDVSEELSASIIRVTRIGELGTLVIISNEQGSSRRLLVLHPNRTTGKIIQGGLNTNLCGYVLSLSVSSGLS
jgi:hypothetical protein